MSTVDDLEHTDLVAEQMIADRDVAAIDARRPWSMTGDEYVAALEARRS